MGVGLVEGDNTVSTQNEPDSHTSAEDVSIVSAFVSLSYL